MSDRVEADMRTSLLRTAQRAAEAQIPLEGPYLGFLSGLADARLMALGADGRILAASPEAEPAWAETLALVRPLPSVGTLHVSGSPYLAVEAKVPWRGASGGPAFILAAVPRARVDAARRDAALPLLTLGILQGLAALLIGSLVAASLTRPLARLAEQARRIADGDRTRRVSLQRNDEIGLLAASLDQMVTSLVQAERLATVGRLATGLAHEIRNPLSSIRMHVQILARSSLASKETTELILSEIERLDGILSGLMDWSRPDNLSLSATDLAPLAAEALDLLAPQLEHRGIRLVRELAEAPLLADRERLRQLLRNLLANARDALGTGGTLTVRTRLAPGAAFLEVADDGPGIPAEIRDRVFEPFVTGRKEGTGLGLALAKRAAEAHGGRISFETGAAGTLFRVELPRLEDGPPLTV